MNVPAPAASLLRGHAAAAPRTLVDVLAATAAAHPGEAAIDDGTTSLSYAELLTLVGTIADDLRARGVRVGDRVGVRMASGSNDLYVAILGVLHAGAAYVPVDADDPEHRAEVVFAEAGVQAVVRDGFEIELVGSSRPPTGAEQVGPSPDDDAWIIFTSGSTGAPKGVAVTHRSAAAFVDAEASLFLRSEPLGPDDRVLAGLSVGFDASCEEMWLAWRHGACLVPAPRSLVRSGVDLGPWLIAQGVTVVSTVPTLAALWPEEALEQVRLLIFGGEACPPSLVARVAADPAREVWNTYGPTEATVVACAARLSPDEEVRIGLPLDGWDLAVVDEAGDPVPPGAVGELVIGGVGLARYLDPTLDLERFAPAPSLGWERAYRSGDLVRSDESGLVFIGRADDQVKIAGRRIELGEVDAALQRLPGVSAAAAAVRRTPAGTTVLIGYLVPSSGVELELSAAADQLRAEIPAALVPRLAVVDELPVRSSGKIDRNALPWPLPSGAGTDGGDAAAELDASTAWVAEQWNAVLGVDVTDADVDFFDYGGSSLSAALLVSALRARYPGATVGDIYDYPRLGALAGRLEALDAPALVTDPHVVAPVPRWTGLAQTALSLPLQTIVGLRWLVWLLTINGVAAWSLDAPWLEPVSWWWIAAGWLVLVSPFGRMALAVVGARLLLRGLEPGTYPRGGSVHLRLWAADQLADAAGAASLAGAPWISFYARALGAEVGPGVDLHSIPPVTGLLTIGAGASIEPEVDLSGHWLDGDRLHIGRITIGAGATVGSRTTLAPGARVGKGAQVAAGSLVEGRVPGGERWSGSPAAPAKSLRQPWPAEAPGRRARWVPVYGMASVAMSFLPVVAVGAGLWVLGRALDGTDDLGEAFSAALLAVPAATVVGFAVLTLLIGTAVRCLGVGVREGTYPVRSRVGFQVWATERLLDMARTCLFPLYASLATPTWLRLLGADVGKGVEASTVLLLPKMTTVAEGAFLADDTMVASYALAGGWMRIARAKIGKRAFLGNSGMTAGGRTVPKHGLVGVLSAAPRKSKAGSSWLGSPPVKLRRRAVVGNPERTFAPPTRLRIARAAIELCRAIPVVVSAAIGVGVLFALQWLVAEHGVGVAALGSGLVILAAGAVAAAVTTLAKWVVVGRISASEHPLWSSFVWRNEVVDTFVEMVAAPWFASAASGTPELALWLRTMGARIGRGVWCETYWLPEADLVRIEDGATVNRGCVLQTHLFHDRVMSTGPVELARGATLGPHGVILPAASIGADATVGPVSLVMRGEHVPASSRWAGNPIGPWHPPKRRAREQTSTRP